MRIPNVVKELIVETQVIWVATSDQAGTPHLAAAKGLFLLGNDRVVFEDWFCYQTLKNIAANPRVALSLLGLNAEQGFQLIGTVEKSVVTEMLDGYMPQEEEFRSKIPQAKHQLQIKVEKILELSTGPHSDEMPLDLET